MSKTNKELAVELALGIITSWNSSGNTKALRPDEAIAIFDKIYNNLTDKSDN